MSEPPLNLLGSRLIAQPDATCLTDVMTKRISVVVVDDNPSLLRELTSILGAELDVLTTATDGKSSLELIASLKPDVVVTDLTMPGLNGIELTKQVINSSCDPPVVICSIETDPEIVDACRQAGASAYVFKSCLKRDLIPAVKSAAQGKPFISSAR